jgi:protein-tyrosine phosphatase
VTAPDVSTDVLPGWHVDVDGCTNFRDAGGWPTVDGGRMRTGRLYRSDDPVRLTPEGRRTVEALGLALAVDLRQHEQWARGPGFLPAERTVHVPLVDRVIDPDDPPVLERPSDLADLYEEMLERSRRPLGRALDHVAGAVGAGPVLVHCAYGKDRAGLVTALVQAAIGLAPDTIVADYVRSHDPAQRRRRWMLAEPLPDDPPIAKAPAYLFAAPGEAMSDLLGRVGRRHGSLDAWVAAFPIDGATIPRLREALLDA